jgi:hypothetical protein
MAVTLLPVREHKRRVRLHRVSPQSSPCGSGGQRRDTLRGWELALRAGRLLFAAGAVSGSTSANVYHMGAL